MFIALRDLRFARGRFALLGSVIALMTFMVVMLSGLTAGLGAASVSAIAKLPVDHIAFQQPADGQKVSFTNSALAADTVTILARQPGVQAAYPIGVSTSQLLTANAAAAVTVIGADLALLPSIKSGQLPASEQVAVTAKLADDQQLRVGDTVVLAGQRLAVAAVVADTSFNHLPVAYTDISTWQRLTHSEGLTAVGLRLGNTSANSLDSVAGVKTVSRSGAFDAVGGYSSEQGSLNLMRGLLIAVSVLVVGSFFTVWTMQRAGDLAIVRAIGASRRYVLGDALGQAGIVLLAGSAAGAALAAGLGVVAAKIVPFELTGATVALPLAAMLIVGLVGAAVSVRQVTKVDPLLALGAAK